MAKTTYNRYGRTHISEESVQNRRSLMMGNRYRNLREEDETTEDQETEDQDGAEEGDEDTDSGEETVTIELTKSEAETLKATLEKITGLYVPFWLFDADVDANVRYRATRITSCPVL